MLKLLGACVKLALFSVLVLVLGNLFYWNGHTISDEVRIKMSHAERSDLFNSMRKWASHLSMDATRGGQRKDRDKEKGRNREFEDRTQGESAPDEEILSSERQKLRALIRELNTSRKED